MRLVDTSAWIEWLIDSDPGKAVEAELPGRNEWIVPTIVQLELAKWLTREVGEDKADQAIAFTESCLVVVLDTALSAAEVSGRHKLATADAIIYATAVAHGADILTCDAHFDGLPGVRLIAKNGRRPSAERGVESK
jgi:predicted nucleic acid-binding protein